MWTINFVWTSTPGHGALTDLKVPMKTVEFVIKNKAKKGLVVAREQYHNQVFIVNIMY